MDNEDEVKILACECIQEMLETLIEDDSDEEEEGKEDPNAPLGNWSYHGTNYNQIIEGVLDNSDDIECTVISVFNLLISIARSKSFNRKKFINLEKTLCFNFHKILPVRISFTLMMKEMTKLELEH